MANRKKRQRHLTLTDRTYIEQEITCGSTFKSIGSALVKDPTTIAKEVKLHSEIIEATDVATSCRNCINYDDCEIHNLCGNKHCKRKCKQCFPS